MKFEAAIKKDRLAVRKANEEDRYRFQIKLSVGHILTAFRPVLWRKTALVLQNTLLRNPYSCMSCKPGLYRDINVTTHLSAYGFALSFLCHLFFISDTVSQTIPPELLLTLVSVARHEAVFMLLL